MLDKRKVALIGEILKSGFPGLFVDDTFDGRRAAQLFRIYEPKGGTRHQVIVSEEFIADHTEQEIEELLKDWTAIAIIKQAGVARVFITNKGVQRSRT